ncbi:hypothetical protein GW17_00039017 [Ensete ventricosum]|nr:hypothetical protein GW17_00039017 [Ensete ventricosum]
MPISADRLNWPSVARSPARSVAALHRFPRVVRRLRLFIAYRMMRHFQIGIRYLFCFFEFLTRSSFLMSLSSLGITDFCLEQDLKPRFHSSRFHGSDNSEEDVSSHTSSFDDIFCCFSQDEDTVNVWNLRKCSAAGLDILSNVFGDEILPTLMPLIQVISKIIYEL